ncbi:MAG: hypothetical protein MUF87_16830 [Anaerolineae bacterium]|jgi:hypothetical protein|nr:hypothetical protein [Anaerolineae bacterium]
MRLILLLILLTLGFTVAAAQPTPDPVLTVSVESAFLRATPIENGELAGSVYENDTLYAIGRNVDGLWLQVRRPGRTTSAGWINRYVVQVTFDVSRLPMTDLLTGVTGPTPITSTPLSVMILGETPLLTAPERFTPIVAMIPGNLTLPVIERTPNNHWLRVNFRGTVGWIAEFLTSTTLDLTLAPISPQYAGDPQFEAYEIVPPEVQIAQLDRLLTWLYAMQLNADHLVTYWNQMAKGETVECRPPADYNYYSYTQRDVEELPELRRQIRFLNFAVDELNRSLVAMRRCGIYTSGDLNTARADATNAQVILRRITRAMENLRARIERFGS